MSEPNFEESLVRLEEIIRQLDGGSTDLEMSLVRYEEGVRLLKNCYTVLNSAQRKIEILRGTSADGQPVLETGGEEDFKTG
ncbi:MAG: exodeoxyribonuclease VII small subunit [Planctomycetaceae bacterium]|jgi:exodeoxyribonuclease VII small subunit|nr:exodeoxyribonuclease VII small subunit [Planctomycetaceae bacterium]